MFQFEDLGGTKEEVNFIAVVHIDGNAMGTRVANVYDSCRHSSWEEFKTKIRAFSESVDADFKAAYQVMCQEIDWNLREDVGEKLDLKNNYFPVRKIIGAGDDVCYVSEGRIGIESAVSFLKALRKQENAFDHQSYAACAGVSIVHLKYPFYRAYELAEMLCSNAKRFGASLSSNGTGEEVSCIDWHIEYGELKDTIQEIRQEYAFGENGTLELRPYIVDAPKDILRKEPFRQYQKFKKLITKIQSQEIEYARGKLKGLRTELKRGEKAVDYYLKFNKLEDLMLDAYQGVYVDVDYTKVGSGHGLERSLYRNGADGITRSLVFDAIEMMDNYLPFRE